MLNRDNVVEKSHVRSKVVEIPEWEDVATIRQLTAEQITAFADIKKDDKRSSTLLIIASLVDENSGLPLFTETEADIQTILNMSAAGIMRLNKAISVFNGLAEAEKNS